MPYPVHMRIAAVGTLDGYTQEEFATGLSIRSASSTDAAVATAKQAFETWWGQAVNHIATGARITHYTAQEVLPNGKISMSSSLGAGNNIRGSAEQKAPAFCSVCLSFDTTGRDSKQRPIRGRMFLPNYTFIQNGSQIQPNDAQDVAASGVGLLSDLKAPTDGFEALQPIVASTSAGGRLLEIVACSADNIYDTMRTRKNQLVPTRHVVPVP